MTARWGEAVLAAEPLRRRVSDDSGTRALIVAALLVFLAGAVVAGVLAYTGRWRSWYPGRFRVTFMPLAAPWFAAAALLMAGLVGLDFLLDPIPAGLALLGVALAIACLLVAGVYAIHPPRRMLPRWIRHLEGDGSPSGPAGGR
ncbi:hypothetical protein [Actinomadura formosensis]|uniref:hypothetical protein n=1 Tax=Actinomadura formosensis TaxID=60706 RepID=UPI00082AC10D|nr:hypothetical protein [Actinomadura formosensis]